MQRDTQDGAAQRQTTDPRNSKKGGAARCAVDITIRSVPRSDVDGESAFWRHLCSGSGSPDVELTDLLPHEVACEPPA